MYKKSFLSLMIMLLLATTSCSSEEPAAIEPGRTISGDAGKTLIRGLQDERSAETGVGKHGFRTGNYEISDKESV